MTKKAASKTILNRFLPQNMSIVLLATLFCFVLGLLYCLSKPILYEASVNIVIKKSDNRALDESTQNDVVSKLFSQSVYQQTAILSDKQNNSKKFDNFYQSLSIRENKDHIALTYAHQNATYAQLVLQSFLTAFRKELADAYPNDLRLIEASRSKRNSLLDRALKNFGKTLQNGEQQNSYNSLFVSLVAAIGNRVAYNASIKVLKNLSNSHQSPLNLDFIANDPKVLKTSGDYARLNSEIAHMKGQLGGDHPQIKAMIAEQDALASELDKNINLAISRLYTEADLAENIENGLRDELNKTGGPNPQNYHHALTELEKNLKSIWDDYDRVVEKAGSFKENDIIVDTGPVKIKKRPVFSQFGGKLFLVILLIFLLFLILSLCLKKCSQNRLIKTEYREKTDGESLKPSVLDGQRSAFDLDQITAKLKQINAEFVSVVGENAARASARLAMGLKNEGGFILLVDISTNEIGNLIGPHRGFTDILAGNAEISEVIYRDYNTGIDILPHGVASSFKAKEFLKDIPTLINSLKSKYAIILVAMTTVPEFGVEELFKQSDCLIISTNDMPDEQKWHNLFLKYSKNLVFTLADN